MKKFMKGCAIAALIMVVIGLAMGVAAGSVRGRTTIAEVVETVTGGRVRINLGPGAGDDWGIRWGDDLFEDWGDVNYDIKDSVNFDSSYEVYRGNVEKYRLEGTVERLEVEVGGCSFQVKDSGDGSFYAEAKNVGKFQAYVESGTLYIRSTTGNVRNWSGISDAKVTLYVPQEGSYSEAKIGIGAGVLSFPKLCADEISVSVGAGKVTMEAVEAETLEIEVGAGQVELTDMKVEELKVEVGVGEFVGDGDVARSVDAECSMGNLELCVAGSQKDFNYEISGAMGNVTLGGSGRHGEERYAGNYGGFATERSIDNGADKDMEITCSMGNVTIRFKD